MSRIEFDGLGAPISTIALPPFGSDSDLTPVVLTFAEDAVFLAQTYRDLGFTHFETWCVGGAGGQGGSIPDANSAIRRISYGGEGGGGGLHVVSGLLVDLPDEVAVVVGKGGASGTDGTPYYRWRGVSAIQYPYGPTIPTMMAVTKDSGPIPGMVDGAGNAIPPYFFVSYSPQLYSLEPAYVAPHDGQDGTASTFNGDTCCASGGTAGKKTPLYDNGVSFLTGRPADIEIGYNSSPGGNGGQGGAGGRIAVGGGGAGATSSAPAFWGVGEGHTYGEQKPFTYTLAEQGTWDGSIGTGGGGGMGGTFDWSGYDPRFYEDYTITRPASSGAHGSFSYGDTSVYGAKGSAQSRTVPRVNTATPSGAKVIPGAGGGARPVKTMKVGSRSPGYSPDGIVIVRLSQII